MKSGLLFVFCRCKLKIPEYPKVNNHQIISHSKIFWIGNDVLSWYNITVAVLLGCTTELKYCIPNTSKTRKTIFTGMYFVNMYLVITAYKELILSLELGLFNTFKNWMTTFRCTILMMIGPCAYYRHWIVRKCTFYCHKC